MTMVLNVFRKSERGITVAWEKIQRKCERFNREPDLEIGRVRGFLGKRHYEGNKTYSLLRRNKCDGLCLKD